VVDLDHGAGDEIAVFELEDAVADEGGEVGATMSSSVMTRGM